MNKGSERIFFFRGSGGCRLLGVLYHPEPHGVRNTGIVYCHPFTEEQNMAHTAAVKACRALCALGYPVLRFDLSGCGDSEGTLDQAGIPAWLEDIGAAMDAIRHESGVPQAALLGLRLGGGLALLSAREGAALPFLILWEPVLDFSLYIRQFLRRSVASRIVADTAGGATAANLEQELEHKGAVNVIGYPISRTLVEGFRSVSRKPMGLAPRCPILLLSISQMDRPSALLRAWRTELGRRDAPVTFDHIQAEPFWDRYWRWECPEVTLRTARWLADLR